MGQDSLQEVDTSLQSDIGGICEGLLWVVLDGESGRHRGAESDRG